MGNFSEQAWGEIRERGQLSLTQLEPACNPGIEAEIESHRSSIEEQTGGKTVGDLVDSEELLFYLQPRAC